jgi:two-component system KDP operon response regulator KdpE
MELLSRVNVQFRKDSETVEELPLVYGSLRLDLNSHTLSVNKKYVKLTPIESKLMETFMRNAGITLTHNVLAKSIWGDYYQNASCSLKVHIRHLREKIETDSSNPDIILTKPYAGYCLAKSE